MRRCRPKKEQRLIRKLLNGLQRGDAPAWLAAEYYLLCGMCRAVLSEMQRMPPIPYTRRIRGEWVPYAFTVSETVDFKADTETMIGALAHFSPDEAFLRTFPTMRAASALCGIALLGNETDMPPSYALWLDQLRRAKRIDWQTVHDRLSAVEAVLMADPAGAYQASDDDTKAAYREAVRRMAKKQGKTDEAAAEEAAARADAKEGLSAQLFVRSDPRCGAWLSAAFVCTALLLSSLTAVLLRRYGIGMAVIVGAVLVLPYCALVREAADILFSRFSFGRYAPVLRIKVDAHTVPAEGHTLTLITALLRGGLHDMDLCDNLERFYLRNRGKGLSFGLLCDLPPSDTAEAQQDAVYMTAVRERIDRLNTLYGERFCLFVRRRSVCDDEKRYMGWERKRGAVLEAARYLRGIGADGFLCAVFPKNIGRISYICTLDEDTQLPPDALYLLIGAMLHPHNRPVIRDGAVRRGSGVLQPTMAVTLEGASATRFTLLCTGHGGLDPYSRYHTDGESRMFGEGSFCGKGIFDVDAYLAVMDGAFPDRAVLSHDFLEGARLGCRNISAVTFSDTVPTTPGAYFARQSRWVRGDVQALRFAFSRHKNARGETVVNPISAAARFRIAEHVIRALIPAAILRAVLVLSFLPFPPGVCCVLCLLLFSPYLLRPLGLCCQVWAGRAFFRRFFGTVYTALRQALYWLFFRITLTAEEGWINARAVVLALYRMLISKKHLLAWVTSNEQEQSRIGGRRDAYRAMWVSVALGGVLVLFSPHPTAKLLGGLWVMAPWLVHAVSQPPKTRYTHRFCADITKKNPADDSTPADYRAAAAPIWQFFAEHTASETNDLPPDNVQWFPITEKRIAHRTSPTNIGLYLCACVAACRFGFITPTALRQRLDDTHRTLCRLKRFRGHFYNWYDTKTCDVIGTPYLSTVDSGNLVCALLCASGGALMFAKDDAGLLRTAENLHALADGTDFSFLYDTTAKQLYLGYNPETDTMSEAHYDLYASEARSAVYYAVASGQIPAAAWEQLERPLTETGRSIGLRSWTGSAFEYFMPALWLPVPENSLDAQMLGYALDRQAEDRSLLVGDSGCVSVFGKSEGAYFAFDAAGNFQYRPYGTASLALCAGMAEQSLCMPYALYLMLPFAPVKVRSALDGLRTIGMAGPYGLYEALDHSPQRVGGGYAAVRSYMAHHMGMSIMALANAAFDGLFVRLFARDRRMEAYRLLLCERIPADAAICPHRPRALADGIPHVPRNDGLEEDQDTSHALLSNTASYLAADRAGGMTLYHGTLAITPTEWALSALAPTVFCRDAETGLIYTPCQRNGDGAQVRYSFVQTEHSLLWSAVYRNGTVCTMTADVSSVGVGFRLELSLTRNGIAVPFRLIFCFRPVMEAPYAYAVHRTFADLFLSAVRIGDGFLIRRRPRASGNTPLELHVMCGGMTEICGTWDIADILPVGYTDADVLALGGADLQGTEIAAHPVSAAVPCLLISGTAENGIASVVLSLGETAGFDADLIAKVRAELRYVSGACFDAGTVGILLSALFGKSAVRLMHAESKCRPLSAMYGRERLWKYGISGDRACFAVICSEDAASPMTAARVLAAWKYLLLCGVRCDLVFCIKERDAYGALCGQQIRGEIEAQGLSFFVGSGLFLCAYADAVRDGVLLSAAYVFGAEEGGAIPAAQTPKLAAVPAHMTPVGYTWDARHMVVIKGQMRMPWTFLLSNGVFGTLLTTDSLGFTFFENARECRITPWYGDAVSERCGEYLLLRCAGSDIYHDLCREARFCVVTPTSFHYLGLLEGISYRISVTVPDRTRHKRMELYLKNDGTEVRVLRLRYQLLPLLGAVIEDREVLSWYKRDRELHIRTETNAACAPYTAQLSLVGCEDIACGSAGDDMLYIGGTVCVPPGAEVRPTCHMRIVREGERAVSADRLVPVRTWKMPHIHSGDAALDTLAAVWLPWQIVTVRMWGRCGYYQPGGAYGFRDQLQDAMAAGAFAPELLYAQLFRAACHQYREGDVQHWWHPGPLTDRAKSHRGIRSRCSDDLLWLPAAAARYARLTGDLSFLSRQVRYLESPPLSLGEEERYETPLRSEMRESLYMHCVRAVECTLARGFGVHGMPYIGSGDWNDGMNRVGIRGQGESVWCGMFLLLVLSEFLPLCTQMGDEGGCIRYADCIKHLASAIEEEAWNGQWYRRAWYDDGTPMGDPGDASAEIDLLPQAFAAIVNARVRLPGGGKPFDEARVHSAMMAAYTQLFDREHGLFALLSPPFGSSEGEKTPDPGYIAAYPPGVRENGGQYTHAAVWGAMGLFAVGETERGMEVVRTLSPLFQTRNAAAAARYRREPWALCGDILRTPGRVGEGGWSLYTGSAGWYYRLLLALFGEDRFEIG